MIKVGTETQLPGQNTGGKPAQNGPPPRALIVGDEPETAALIQETLESAEIDAASLASDREADAYFQKEKFDVIFIDLSRTSANGYELVRKIRQIGLNQGTPIIVISQDQRPVATLHAFEAGTSFFLYKPVNRARLAKLIRVVQGSIAQEKRRFRRVPVRVKALLKTRDSALVGETTDISMNGVLVTASRVIPVGSLVEVSLYLVAETAPIFGLGTVVRILNGTQMGILFDRRSVAESGRLQDYLLSKVHGELSAEPPSNK